MSGAKKSKTDYVHTETMIHVNIYILVSASAIESSLWLELFQ